jgi:outer membrane protein OmpA-like peptidoglycan-associated protein
MKIQHLALFALAAVFTAGCSPKNPPSGYDADGNKIGGDTVTTAPTDISNDPNGLSPRGPAGNIADISGGDPNKIPEGAKLCVIHFGFDKYTVEAGERAKIDASLAAIKGKRIGAWGYSDFFGTEDYNLGLSDKRANSVKAYIAKIGGGEADVHAYGEQFAKQSGDKSAVADDRKVILVDLDYKGN